MTKVILSETLRSMLPDLSQPIELCDASGRIVGHIFPVADTPTIVSEEPQTTQRRLRPRKEFET
ncbi:MAG TPA: hypothetical protein VN688_31660 [Gemmataceae bacterium]|nr:hypothetical protein [Gemmataceae bacterium]